MISLVKLFRRKPAPTSVREGLQPSIVALILGLILCLQIGLVLWVYLTGS